MHICKWFTCLRHAHTRFSHTSHTHTRLPVFHAHTQQVHVPFTRTSERLSYAFLENFPHQTAISLSSPGDGIFNVRVKAWSMFVEHVSRCLYVIQASTDKLMSHPNFDMLMPSASVFLTRFFSAKRDVSLFLLVVICNCSLLFLTRHFPLLRFCVSLYSP